MEINKDYTPSEHVLAFDLDNTLVRNTTKRKFAKDADDWQFTSLVDHISVENIVIFTNQNYKKLTFQIDRVNNIISALKDRGINCHAYISTAGSNWKKPYPAMALQYAQQYGVPQSFVYVGDAAGRAKDFSDSDRAFSHNAGIALSIITRFYTPEEYIMLHNAGFFTSDAQLPTINDYTQQVFSYDGFDPDEYLANLDPELTQKQQRVMERLILKPTLIITVGAPGSGKSTFARRLKEIYPDLTIVDESNKKKRLKAIRDAPGSVICSQTNPTQELRDEYTAQKPDYKVVVIYWDNIELAKHMNCVRHVLGEPLIPTISYTMYSKKLEVPRGAILWRFDAQFESNKEAEYFHMRF